MTPQQRRLYFNQQDVAGMFYTFHSDAFNHLETEELELLDTCYFIRRDIDVDNVADYAAMLFKNDPTLWNRAEAALRKVCTELRLDDRMMRELFPERQTSFRNNHL